MAHRECGSAPRRARTWAAAVYSARAEAAIPPTSHQDFLDWNRPHEREGVPGTFKRGTAGLPEALHQLGSVQEHASSNNCRKLSAVHQVALTRMMLQAAWARDRDGSREQQHNTYGT